jgi:hypothetical protein
MTDDAGSPDPDTSTEPVGMNSTGPSRSPKGISGASGRGGASCSPKRSRTAHHLGLAQRTFIPLVMGLIGAVGGATAVHLHVGSAISTAAGSLSSQSGAVHTEHDSRASDHDNIEGNVQAGKTSIQQSGHHNNQQIGQHDIQQNGQHSVVNLGEGSGGPGGNGGTGGPGGTGGAGGTGGKGGVIYVSPRPTSQAPEPCIGNPANLTVPPTTGPTFLTTINVACPPSEGRDYYLVIQLDNVPPNDTTNFYEKVQVPPAPGTYTYTIDVSHTAVGISRQLFIVSADLEEAAQLENAASTGLANALPEGTQVVSPVLKSTRVN